MSAPYKYVCNDCGADDTIHAGGFVEWDAAQQTWVFFELQDGPFWCTCGADNNFRQEPVSDLKIVAQHAIKQAANTP